jgi:hypothetical protein
LQCVLAKRAPAEGTCAHSLEETDARIYADFAAGLKADYPATAQIFSEMEAEEDGTSRRLIEQYRRRFGRRGLMAGEDDARESAPK